MSATETGVAGERDTAAVAAFLYHEADLLDSRRYEEWLGLYTDDAIYWIPQGDDADHVHQVSIAYDDHRRLHERVLRLGSGFAFSQDPPSRTCHVVGNVRIAGELDGDLDVRSNLVLAEMRRGLQSVYAGQVTHQLVPTGESFLVRRKTIRLINSDIPLSNLTFLI
ncbi:MAG TPA: aromatic-ring-hydroxylating dioxygenase subunit beta [Thermoleophilaceae bacterium]|nr:aromatic-ring-hydroxylating dioxygenase subunit beta [Thermoleophilaceae bacterium]